MNLAHRWLTDERPAAPSAQRRYRHGSAHRCGAAGRRRGVVLILRSGVEITHCFPHVDDKPAQSGETVL